MSSSREPILHGAYATSAVQLPLDLTPSPSTLSGSIMETRLIRHAQALLSMRNVNALFPRSLLRLASSPVSGSLARLETIVRAALLFMGSDAFVKRFVVTRSMFLSALRQMGSPIPTCGTAMHFTTLALATLSAPLHARCRLLARR